LITLCGFPASNYYNKVKLALLEKGIPFEERLVYPTGNHGILGDSPMGKVPYILGDGYRLSESQAIVEYLEDVYPGVPLYPSDPRECAKARELIQVIELYLELPARRLYSEAFFGGRVPEDAKREVAAALTRGARALERMARFGPFIAGADFGHVDCAAFAHLPLVSGASKIVLGHDPLAGISAIPGYLEMVAARPHAQRVNVERKAGVASFVAQRKRG
jgi:glutathione S-transferase